MDDQLGGQFLDEDADNMAGTLAFLLLREKDKTERKDFLAPLQPSGLLV